MTKDFNDSQRANAQLLMRVTLLGMMTDSNELHDSKVSDSIVAILLGMLMDFKDLHSSNAL
jgi:hypothetical protein